ncbi:hypothetical protein K8M09_18110 [Shinella zoogloeoides]|nr:hypothetical protein K8M09_18110 [Shinella zoogloeoides]
MSLPRSIKIGYAVFFDHVHTPVLLRKHAAQLFQWVADGKLKVRIGGECRKVGTFETSLFLTFDHEDNRDDDIPTGSFT